MFNLSKDSCHCTVRPHDIGPCARGYQRYTFKPSTVCLCILITLCTLLTVTSPVSSSSPSLFTPHLSSASRPIVRRPRFHSSTSRNSVNESSSTASKIVPVESAASTLSVDTAVSSPLLASARSLSPTSPLSPSSTGIHRCTGHWRYPSGCKGSSCQYLALWKYNYERDQVDFQVSTNRPDKWVGIGFSKDTKMPGSDAIIAWVEPGSRYVMMDAWLDSYGTPIADVKQSISNISAAAANGLISFFFSRPTNTGDTVHDVNLDDCFHLIFPVNGGSVDIKNRSVMKHEKTPTVTPQKFCLSSCHSKKAPSTVATTTPSTATRLNGNSPVKSESPSDKVTSGVSTQSADKIAAAAAGESTSSTSSSASGVTIGTPVSGASPAVTNLQDNERGVNSGDSEIQKLKSHQSSQSTVSTSTSSTVTSVSSSGHSSDDEAVPIYKAPSSSTTVSESSGRGKNDDAVNSSQSVTSTSVTNSHDSVNSSKHKSMSTSEGSNSNNVHNSKNGQPIDSTGDGESNSSDDDSAITSCKGEWKYPSRCTGYGCDYKATWEYLDAEDEIKFTISTKNKNKWTGIAFSSDRSMPATDAIIGLVEDSGRFFLMDTWLRSYAAPSLDPIQNIQNMSVSRENGVTSLRFHRKRKTGDKNDFQFSDTNCPYFQFPVQGGVFNAVNKRLRKHESVPIVSTRRICIKSCAARAHTTSTTVSISSSSSSSSVTNSLDSDRVTGSTVPSVSSTPMTVIAATSNKSTAPPDAKLSHDVAANGKQAATASTTSISSSTSSSSTSTSSSSSSAGATGINLKDWNFSQLGPSVVDLSKLSASSNIPGMKSIPDLTSLLNQMNVSSGGNLPSILRTLANKLPPSNSDATGDTNQSPAGKSSNLPTFTGTSSDTHSGATSPTVSSSDSVSPSTSTMASVATVASAPTRGESTVTSSNGGGSSTSSTSSTTTSSTSTTKSPGSYRKVTPKVNGKIPDRWTTSRTTTSTSTIASVSDDETDGEGDVDDDEDDEVISTKGKKKINNSIVDSNIKIHESKYEVELKLPKAWKASYARRQSEEFVTFKEKIEQQLKQELEGQFSSLDVQVMEMTGVQETVASPSKGQISRQSSVSSSTVSTTSAAAAATNSPPSSPGTVSSVTTNGGENSLIAKVRLSVKSTVPLTSTSNSDHVPTRQVKESSKTANTVITSSSTPVDDLTPVKITEALNSAIRDGRIGDVAVDSNYLIVRSIEAGTSDGSERYLTDEQLKWTVIISGVAALVALVLMQAGFMIWRDKKNKSSFTSTSGKDSSASLGAHHSYHGYNLSHPNLHGHLYDDIHRSQVAGGGGGTSRLNGKKDLRCDRDYLGDHHYYHGGGGHHLTQSELNHPSTHTHHGHAVSSNHTHAHHAHHHHHSHHNGRPHNGGGGGNSSGGGASSGGSSSSNAQLDTSRHQQSGTRHPQSHKLSSLNAMQPDFYFLRHQRRYSGNLL